MGRTPAHEMLLSHSEALTEDVPCLNDVVGGGLFPFNLHSDPPTLTLGDQEVAQHGVNLLEDHRARLTALEQLVNEMETQTGILPI